MNSCNCNYCVFKEDLQGNKKVVAFVNTLNEFNHLVYSYIEGRIELVFKLEKTNAETVKSNDSLPRGSYLVNNGMEILLLRKYYATDFGLIYNSEKPLVDTIYKWLLVPVQLYKIYSSSDDSELDSIPEFDSLSEFDVDSDVEADDDSDVEADDGFSSNGASNTVSNGVSTVSTVISSDTVSTVISSNTVFDDDCSSDSTSD